MMTDRPTRHCHFSDARATWIIIRILQWLKVYCLLEMLCPGDCVWSKNSIITRGLKYKTVGPEAGLSLTIIVVQHPQPGPDLISVQFSEEILLTKYVSPSILLICLI